MFEYFTISPSSSLASIQIKILFRQIFLPHRSNEATITNEIEKHGEIYCANKDTGEINILTEDIEGSRKVSALGRLKRSSRTEDKIIMFTELEDGFLAGSYDGSMGYDGVLQDSEVWKLLGDSVVKNQSHLLG